MKAYRRNFGPILFSENLCNSGKMTECRAKLRNTRLYPSLGPAAVKNLLIEIVKDARERDERITILALYIRQKRKLLN